MNRAGMRPPELSIRNPSDPLVNDSKNESKLPKSPFSSRFPTDFANLYQNPLLVGEFKKRFQVLVFPMKTIALFGKIYNELIRCPFELIYLASKCLQLFLKVLIITALSKSNDLTKEEKTKGKKIEIKGLNASWAKLKGYTYQLAIYLPNKTGLVIHALFCALIAPRYAIRPNWLTYNPVAHKTQHAASKRFGSHSGSVKENSQNPPKKHFPNKAQATSISSSDSLEI